MAIHFEYLPFEAPQLTIVGVQQYNTRYNTEPSVDKYGDAKERSPYPSQGACHGQRRSPRSFAQIPPWKIAVAYGEWKQYFAVLSAPKHQCIMHRGINC